MSLVQYVEIDNESSYCAAECTINRTGAGDGGEFGWWGGVLFVGAVAEGCCCGEE